MGAVRLKCKFLYMHYCKLIIFNKCLFNVNVKMPILFPSFVLCVVQIFLVSLTLCL